jgi:hypothetical protein
MEGGAVRRRICAMALSLHGGQLNTVATSENAVKTKFAEPCSLLKKYVSARSAVQESPKTRPKRYRNGVFGPRTGSRRERDGVFQQADPFHAVG